MPWQTLGDIRILIVEDDPFNRLLIKSLLGKLPQIHFLEAGDGLEALEKLETQSVDIILLDLHMPNMNGHETLIELNKRKLCDKMAILAMTTDEAEKQNLYSKGADDFISKPFRLDELGKKIYQNIIKKRKTFELYEDKIILAEREAVYTSTEIQSSQKDFFLKMVSLKTKAKPENRLKAKIIAVLSKEFALKLGYSKAVSNDIYHASLIRDIGVIALDFFDENKKISETEKKVSQEYILLGYQMVSGAIETDFINVAKTVILQHKEFYDGSGIPYGIKGKEISDMAVIVAIVETFEAMLSKRAYRSPEQYKAREVYTIFSESHYRFNPKILEIFLKYFPEFVALRESLLVKKITRNRKIK